VAKETVLAQLAIADSCFADVKVLSAAGSFS
jgi:hypothetical protein